MKKSTALTTASSLDGRELQTPLDQIGLFDVARGAQTSAIKVAGSLRRRLVERQLFFANVLVSVGDRSVRE